MFVQNGSAILVAILAEHYFGDLGITLVSIGFTLAYFIVVEAMSKTYAILHSDRAALAVAPVVWLLGKALALPTRLLIGVANILLPGKGSIFEFGDTIVRQIMVPRPDIVAVEAKTPLQAALDMIVEHDLSRIPIYREDLDRVEGILYAKDVLKALHQGRSQIGLRELVRPAHFVPESCRASTLQHWPSVDCPMST